MKTPGTAPNASAIQNISCHHSNSVTHDCAPIISDLSRAGPAAGPPRPRPRLCDSPRGLTSDAPCTVGYHAQTPIGVGSEWEWAIKCPFARAS
jgi:hypothetical protein